MTTWHGYEQPPGAAEDAPWWGLVDLNAERQREAIARGHDVYIAPEWGWRRTDGVTTLSSDEIDRIDAETPLAYIGPRLGQAWVEEDISYLVDFIQILPAGEVWVFVGGGRSWLYKGPRKGSDWPRPGACLVAGPGAPWKDTRR